MKNQYKIRKFTCLGCNKEVEARRSKNNLKFCSVSCHVKLKNPFLGKKHTPEVKAIIIKNLTHRFPKGHKGYRTKESFLISIPKTISTRKKNGWFSSEEMEKACIHNLGDGMLGKKHSFETCLKMQESAKNNLHGVALTSKGEGNVNWQGGISFEPYTIDWTETLKKAIRERDHYICQLCSQYGNVVHHIDYCKKNCNPNNLITLCRECHTKTNQNRDYWLNYFTKTL